MAAENQSDPSNTSPATEQSANPWGAATASQEQPTNSGETAAELPQEPATNPWGAGSDTGDQSGAASTAGDWLTDTGSTAADTGLDLANPFQEAVIPLTGLLAWQAAGRRLAIGAVISMVIVGLIGAWSEAIMAAENQSDPSNTSPATEQSANPWGAATASQEPTTNSGETAAEPPQESATNPWGVESDTGDQSGPVSTAGDWLTDTDSTAADTGLDLAYPFQEAVIPLGAWVDQGLEWLVNNFRGVFQAIRWPIDTTLTSIESALQAVPDLLMLVIIGLLAWQAAGRRLAIGAVISMAIVGLIGAWSEAMVTLSLVITSVFFCLVIGLPVGIWLARNDHATAVVRPILDAMQTTPAFVYLVPVVMLFGIGNVPGVVVTIIFALPPLIRLTSLGIRQVPGNLVEAARSFGASPRQLLFKVQLPLAMPTIMAGVNQTLMLALSMVVIASMIAVGGLGQMVLRGIGRLDMGLATIGGVGIVILAIILDRMTQAVGQARRDKPNRHWYESGPAGLAMRLLGRGSVTRAAKATH